MSVNYSCKLKFQVLILFRKWDLSVVEMTRLGAAYSKSQFRNTERQLVSSPDEAMLRLL